MSNSEYQANLDLQGVPPTVTDYVCECCGGTDLEPVARGWFLRGGYDAHCYDCDQPTFKVLEVIA